MNWIWTANSDLQRDAYRDFRKTLTITEVDLKSPVTLEISADSKYDVFVNAKRCPITQFSDFANEKTVARYDIATLLKPGKNVIAVRVHFVKERFFTYTPGHPGLALQLKDAAGKLLIESDASWKCRADKAYTSGAGIRVTPQLDFVFAYDARQEDAWLQADYDDTSWQNAIVQQDFERKLLERPVPFLNELTAPDVRVMQVGWLTRTDNNGTVAAISAKDALRSDWNAVAFKPENFKRLLSPDGAKTITFKSSDDCYAIFDVGQETVGYLELDIEAAAGTVIDVLHGEHLDDGRVRCLIGPRNFGDRYICRNGRNTFRHTLRRLGARFIELHITRASQPVVIHYAGLTPVELPLAQAGALSLDDRLFTRVYDVAVDTLKLCMHEHYEDCPWREQSLYAYDSRNQMLYGYNVWGNYDFAKASLDLLGRSYFGNGDIGIVAPSRPDDSMLMIPSFTLVWISELYDHCMHSGSPCLFEKFQDTVWDIISKAISRQDGTRTLYKSLGDKNTWNFYEWTPYLSRLNDFPQSPYNLYLYEAMVSASKLYGIIGNSEKAEQLARQAEALGKCLETTFWDEENGCYTTLLPGRIPSSEHVQALMLYNGLVPKDKQERIFSNFQNKKLIGLSYSVLAYYVRGMMEGTPDMRAAVEPFLFSQFDEPVLNGATSLWETVNGGDDFGFAGSLCHAWSSIHAYYAKRYLLGVSPLTPGYKTFEVKPYPGNHLSASGEIPTPHGFISVSWTRHGKVIDLTVKHPRGLKPIITSYPEYTVNVIK